MVLDLNNTVIPNRLQRMRNLRLLLLCTAQKCSVLFTFADRGVSEAHADPSLLTTFVVQDDKPGGDERFFCRSGSRTRRRRAHSLLMLAKGQAPVCQVSRSLHVHTGYGGIKTEEQWDAKQAAFAGGMPTKPR